MVATQPVEREINAPDILSSHQVPINDCMCRIYRRTPTPTIILNGSLRVLEASDSNLPLFRLSRDQVLGMSIHDLAPRIVRVGDVPLLTGALNVAIRTQAVQVIRTSYVTEIDTSFTLRVTPIFEADAFIYIILELQDVSYSHHQIKLRTGENVDLNEIFESLVDTIRDYAIVMLDTEGHVATWNAGAATLKGYHKNEIIGKHFSIFYGDQDRQMGKPVQELEACLQEGRIEDEGWRYHKDGGQFWANVIITPIYKFGRHVGFAKVTRDLAERKAAEARLIETFEESSKLKSDFLASMSHELRTPMNGMVLALDMLMLTPLNKDQQELAEIFQDSTSTLLKVVNDVLDYSKLSSNTFSLNVDMLDIPCIVHAVIRNCQPSLRPGVALESSVAPNYPRVVRGDHLRFQQVLQNLVSNAVKYTESGYVHVKTSYSVDPIDSESYIILIEVVDSGIGVSDDAVNTLFTPFTRFADSATKRYQGTGLGLSICKNLAELMSGTVAYHKNPDGAGSVFEMSIKMERVDLPDTQTRPLPALASRRPSDVSKLLQEVAPRKQVLLAEDNPLNQTVMLKMLASLGFHHVALAWDGNQAVCMVKQKPLAYSLILMDITMPVMDGLVATRRIRQTNVHIPIIALTGHALKGDAETYLASGMNDYISKPVRRQQLVDRLWRWCGS